MKRTKQKATADSATKSGSGIGVIVEDETDFDALKVLVRRIVEAAGPGPQPKVRKRGQRGCGPISQKIKAWMADLVLQGCTKLIVVRDRDARTEASIRQELQKHPPPAAATVCIPVEELEAWFWSDLHVLRLVAPDARNLKAPANPHLVKSPKEKLEALSVDARRRPRYSNSDNARLAETLGLDVCAAKCPSFRHFRDFVLAPFPLQARWHPPPT
ncbi:MAG: DUF4276 family protein [Polyangiaceae bacterium]